MKILAIEEEINTVDWNNETLTLIQEARSCYNLMLTGELREIYFTENKQAVLILECENKMAAELLLSELPLVKKKLIDFEIMELQPYTGFTRLMK